ncbi:hypothetical protein CPB84DRAFT_1654702, partial [Gymnopilus junonius]
LNFIQKHALIHALCFEKVELVEKQTLGGVDLIVDPKCVIIFHSLFTLPARCAAYVERVSEQSWKFENLLIIFEAFPESSAKRAHGNSRISLYAYTPPIVKALKKFRWDIMEHAFANDVNKAAAFMRWYGDRAEEQDEMMGVIWGERPW